MLVSIIGLPPTITYQELKALIKQQCNLTDFIVDNIVSIQGGTKKVRIGVSDDGDAMRIVKGLNGYILPGNFVLKVAIVGKTQSNQQGMAFESQNQYPTRNDFSTQRTDYRSSHDPIEAMSRPQPWGPNINQDQNIWTQETSIGQQMSHDSFSYHHQQQQQGYGQQTPFTSQRPDVAQYSQESQFGGKPNIPRHVETRSHVLRTIEIVDSPNLVRPPVQQGRYPPVHGYQQDKPVTMVKDNFQGPSFAQGNQQQGPGHYQGASHDKPQPWTHQNAGPYEKHYAEDLKGPLDKRDLKTTQQMRNQNFKDYEKSTIPPQRKPSPGRSEPVGRTQHGRPTSPKNARRHVSPQKPGTLGKQSPVRAGMRGRSPVRSGPGRQSPTRPSMHTRMSPGRDSGQPITPDRPARLGRPTSQKQGYVESVVPNRHSPDRKTSGRPGSPNNYSDRGRGMDGRPNMTARPVSPGRQYGGRLVSPERLIPVRPGSPINRQPVGRQPALGKDVSPGRSLLGRPGLQAHSSGRPVSPTMRSTKRIGLPSMRPSGRPGSPDPNKYGTFRSRSNSPLPITDRPIQGRPGSPRRFVYVRPGSPGIRMATQQRSGQGKHGSPSGRRMSPSNRMASASGILGSPMRRNSPNHRHPGGREDSPNQVSPHPKDRYSSTHDLETLDKYGQNSKSKLVRPAYDCLAPNKAMYSGGFHHNVHENKYGRPGDQPWQKDDKYQKIEDDRRESRIPPRSIETEKRVHASERKSRSPIRRERSPFRDRLKRHSPSPRSPRRSWALEKRRSPEIREAPPPPIWPGQKRDDDQVHRRNIPDRSGNEENIKHTPVWNLQLDGKEVEHRREDRRLEKTERGLEEKDRNRRDIRNPHSERFAPQNEMQPNFSPQQINEKRDFLLNEEKRFSERQERRDLQRRSVDREDRHREEFSHYRNYSPQRLEEHSIRKNFDKELEDIYKRAVEFRRKTEEIRRSGERRREDYRDDERLNIKEGTTTDYQRSRQPNSPVNRNYQQNPSEEPRRISREKVEWKIESKPSLPEHVRAKREKAIKEIVKRLLERQRICDHLDREYEERVTEELKLEISKIVYRLFGNEDVSFIEIIIKYQAKYSIKDEEMLLHAVLNSLQKSNKNLKRPAPDTSEVHSKVARRSPVAAHQEGTRMTELNAPKTKSDHRRKKTRCRKHRQLEEPQVKAGEPKLREPQVSKPKLNEPQDSKPKLNEPQASKPKLNEPQASKPKLSETRVSKPQVSKPKVPPQRPSKTIAKAEEKIDKEPTPTAQKKPEEHQPSIDLTSDGYYELSPLMTRMLEKELQDIMIKVWQALPDSPSDKAEKIVVESFRNKAGDDLRNVLGLNVTKRLLDIHNPLSVKVQFTRRPERDHLKAFLLKYRCIKFERVDSEAKTFMALMKNIQDFDKICSVKTLRIGSIKVYISPNYDFYKYPPNLKTIFGDFDDDIDKEPDSSDKILKAEIKSSDKDNENIQNVPTSNEKNIVNVNVDEKKVIKSDIKSAQKSQALTEVKKSPKKIEQTPKNVDKATVINKPVVEYINVESKECNKNEAAITKKTLETKVGDKKAVNKLNESNKTNTTINDIKKPIVQETKVNETSKTTRTKLPAKPTEVCADNPDRKVTNNNEKIDETNKNSVKSQTKEYASTNKSPVKSHSGEAKTSQSVAKPIKKIEESNRPNQKNLPENNKVPPKVANLPKVINKKNVTQKTHKQLAQVDHKTKAKGKTDTLRILKEGDDYDVLDDKDILALISGGIILDECSGSDTD